MTEAVLQTGTTVFVVKRRSQWRALVAVALSIAIVTALLFYGSFIAAGIVLVMTALALFVTVDMRSPDRSLELRSDGLVLRQGRRSLVMPWNCFDRSELLLLRKAFVIRLHYARDSEAGRRFLAGGAGKAYLQIAPADYAVEAKELFDLIQDFAAQYGQQRRMLQDAEPHGHSA